MKNSTSELTEKDYLILKYIHAHPNATEKDLITALRKDVEGIKFRLEKLSTKEVTPRANGTMRSTEAYISRMNQVDSRAYSLNSKGKLCYKTTTSKRNPKRSTFGLKTL